MTTPPATERRTEGQSLAQVPLLSLLQYKLGMWLDSPILIKASRARLWGSGAKWWQRVLRVVVALTLATIATGIAISAYILEYHALLPLLVCEGIICILLIPALAGGAIANEHEKQTIEPLLITPLSSTQIVVGKVLAAVCPTLLIQILCLPLLIFTAFVEETSPLVTISSQAILLLLSLTLGAISVFCSSLCRKTITGVIVAYCACLLWLISMPCLLILWAHMTEWQVPRGVIFIAPLAIFAPLLTPYVALRIAVLRLDSLRNSLRDPQEKHWQVSA